LRRFAPRRVLLMVGVALGAIAAEIALDLRGRK
jgi:hypothetical protein